MERRDDNSRTEWMCRRHHHNILIWVCNRFECVCVCVCVCLNDRNVMEHTHIYHLGYRGAPSVIGGYGDQPPRRLRSEQQFALSVVGDPQKAAYAEQRYPIYWRYILKIAQLVCCYLMEHKLHFLRFLVPLY
jgi:hypothetical protein